MIKKQAHTNKIILTLVVLTLCFSQSIGLNAQKSPIQLRIGYEQVYVSPNTTNDIAQKSWIWIGPDGNDEYETMRTTLTHAWNVGIRYDIFKWMSISLDYKNYYRRYYLWSGTYLFEEWRGHSPGQYRIVPYGGLILPSTFLGRTLSTSSWQLGVDFHHSISKNNQWHLHYFLSFNRDLYERELHYFDTPVNYGGTGWYIRAEDNQRIETEVDGRLELKAFNPGQSAFMPSTNIALAVSKKMRNGTGLRLELGLRNILWTKNILLRENHWDIQMTKEDYILDPATGSKNIVLTTSIQHKFPLYIGGIYSNLSYTLRPFRSPRDREGYVPLNVRMRNFFKKIF